MQASSSASTSDNRQDDDDEPCGIPLVRGSELIAVSPATLLPLLTTRGELRRMYEEEDRQKAEEQRLGVLQAATK